MLFLIPWTVAAIAVPLIGACWVRTVDDPHVARRHSLLLCAVTLLLSCGGAWASLAREEAGSLPADVVSQLAGQPIFVLDDISRPLVPLAALLHVLLALASLHTRGHRFSFSRMLAAEAVLIATFSCQQPWLLVVLLLVQTFFPLVELRLAQAATAVYSLHMAVFAGCLIVGQTLVSSRSAVLMSIGIGLLLVATFIRSGVFPGHVWVADLFGQVSLRTALLFMTPMSGVYCGVRLLLPVAPSWALQALVVAAAFSSFYAAGMALVQCDARRFFCYLLLSQSALVLMGLGSDSAIAVTGALCMWISIALALTGFGITLRAVEARMGTLSLRDFNGLYELFPHLAVLFLITGLASVGFPGTVGFVGSELLIDGTIAVQPLVGVAIVVSTALNGLAIMAAYFRLFTGRRRTVYAHLRGRPLERLAVLLFVLLILGGGIFPQPGVRSQFVAAERLLEQRLGRDPAAGDSEAPAKQAAIRVENLSRSSSFADGHD